MHLFSNATVWIVGADEPYAWRPNGSVSAGLGVRAGLFDVEASVEWTVGAMVARRIAVGGASGNDGKHDEFVASCVHVNADV